MTQKITPHLWFDKEAKGAAKLYTSLFPKSKITNVTTLHDTPSGDADIVSFELAGQPFMAISAGPYFKFNPSVSFLVACKTKEEVDAFWKRLSDGGRGLMPLDAYPFSERYGWIEDKYGLSWQVMYVGDLQFKQKISPFLMFVGKQYGKAEQAINFYASVFHDARIDYIERYGKEEAPDKEGAVKHAGFVLEGEYFSAMDSAHKHKFAFNEAVSFIVYCKDQKEIDYYWEKLSADPKAEQCGWLKDKFGVSWQIVPTVMDEMMSKGTPEQIVRVTGAFLKMKKFDIAKLKEAYKG